MQTRSLRLAGNREYGRDAAVTVCRPGERKKILAPMPRPNNPCYVRRMKRRETPLEAITRRISGLDAGVIDELYGLEPVYEPDGPARALQFGTEFVSILCPYCWERYETQVDLTGGSFTYVEDCQVCCQPIELTCEVGTAGELLSVKPERMD
jgi:Cysteine-rich CPXCG